MRVSFLHKEKKQTLLVSKSGLLRDIAPRWFPPNTLLQVSFNIHEGRVCFEENLRSIYIKLPSTDWKRMPIESRMYVPPFSISASPRGTCIVTFQSEKHEQEAILRGTSSNSIANKLGQKHFTTAESSNTSDRHESFASVSSTIINVKEANQSSLLLSDLSPSFRDPRSTKELPITSRLRMHPSLILQQDPLGTGHPGRLSPSVLHDSDLSLTTLQPKEEVLYILTVCQDTSQLEELLTQILNVDSRTNMATGSHQSTDLANNTIPTIGRYIIIRRVFDMFVHLSYNWNMVIANRNSMLCLIDGVGQWIDPVLIFSLLTNIPIYYIKDYIELLYHCQQAEHTEDPCQEANSFAMVLPFAADLQAITLNGALSQTLFPSRKTLLKTYPNTLYSSIYPSDRPSLPKTFFLSEIETTVFASAHELLNLHPQATLIEIQTAIHKYLDWSLALTANHYNIWVRLALKSTVYHRLSHEIDQLFQISHCLTSSDLIGRDSVLISLDAPSIEDTSFNIQNFAELLLRGPHTVIQEGSVTDV